MGEKATLTAKIEAIATVLIMVFAVVAVYYAVRANSESRSNKQRC